MRFLSSSVLPLIAIRAVLSLPQNLSVLQLPSYSLPRIPVITNATLLGNWPPVPWNLTIERHRIIFNRYGRWADPSLRSEVVESIRDLREWFLKATIKPKQDEIHRQSGVIRLAIGFTGRQLLTGKDISEALEPLEVFYGDETWRLTEIISGQIGTPGPWVPLGAFQILFKHLFPESRAAHL